ncbi:hypothetical protein K1T71_008510 [Dendrolimus kikuchii]|uniref:Uncharacterized protein n=1 Tax=Dendrolimus kikuchii TaxID=765133 RepID=A0ACC1CXK4_9NEOP|nr:hypothetical protein K1T71_008510 [Dendrolimus kikuchii]
MNNSSRICRICLENHNTLFSLFGRRKGVSPYDKLTKINLSIDINDSEKSFICLQCLSDLDTAVNFFERCEKANEILTVKYVSSSHKNEDVEGNTKEITIELNNTTPKLDFRLNESITEPEVVVKELSRESNLIDFEEGCSCPDCGSKRRCQHWTPAKTHTCQYCQKVFNRKFNFKIHLKRHLGERDWPCPTCGVQQITRNLADKHCAAKTRKLCPVSGCGKSYTTITNLNTHLRVHNGEKPFKCNDCGKGFASKTRLGDHLRIHTGEKPYICPVCGKQFTTNRLTVHMWTHADAASRPHVCQRPGCSKRFSTKTALQLHGSVHAGAAQAHAYSCALCGAKYIHRQSLNKHTRKHHGQMFKPSSKRFIDKYY